MNENDRTLTVFITLLLITPFLCAQSPTIEWANHMGGKGIDLVNHITTDLKGNVLVTDLFMDTVDFDPGSEMVNLTFLFKNWMPQGIYIAQAFLFI